MDRIVHSTSRKNQELLIQNSSKASEEILSPITQSCTLPPQNIGDTTKPLCLMVIHSHSGSKLEFAMLQAFTLLKSKE